MRLTPYSDLTWPGADKESWEHYKTRVAMSDDPHAKPLGEAIRTGWSIELRTEGGSLKAPDCWLHTTSDGIIHIGWARTYCGIEVQWELSVIGEIAGSTCPDCVADWTSSKLDPNTWRARQEAK